MRSDAWPPVESTIHQMLQRWIDSTPDRIAVRDGVRSLTYRELSERADNYAGQLYACGIRPGATVPVRLPKSVDLIAVLVAILRVGAAYSLIGFDWPSARVRSVLDQLSAPVLVGEHPDEDTEGRRPAWWPSPGSQAISYPPVEVSGQSPYAVFFTSGTTGQPKGAVCPHAGVTRLLSATRDSPFRIRAACPQSLALPWDFSALEIWATLLSGATLVLVQDRYLTGSRLRKLIEDDGIDTLMLATAVFATLAEESPESFADLDKLIVGGEALTARQCAAVLSRFPDLELINAYGPVEAGIFTTTHQVELTDCQAGLIPIGDALPATNLRIEPTSAADGELLVGGPGIAHGYLGDPALTAERFVTRLIDGAPQVWYRTGDLVHRDAAGRLWFRGRVDDQVKVSGLRVDPAEVEALIASTPGVRACSVLAHRPQPDRDQVLAAFVVVDPGLTATVIERDYAERLAPFQRPSSIHLLDALPLSLNGKIDRAALNQLVSRSPSQPVPDTETDSRSADIRAVLTELLGVQLSGQTDDSTFRELGVTSLELGRIASRLGSRLGHPIPLSAVFEHDSVRALTDHLARSETVAAPPAGRRDDLTPAQLYFLSDHLRDPDSLDQNCLFAWHAPGPVDLARLGATFDHLHARHEAFRSRYELRRGSRITPVLLRPPALVSERVRTMDHARSMLDRLGQRRFRPRQGQIWFPFVISIDEPSPTTVFGLCAHHVAIDGGSAQTLAGDIADCFHQLTAGIQPSLPPAASVATAVHVRQDGLARVDAGRQRQFWSDYLHDVVAPNLPSPGASDAAAPPGVATSRATLTLVERQRLEQAARRLQVSSFSLYLSAYAETMHRLTGATDLPVLTAVDQRTDQQLRRSVNCLIALLCLRLHAPTSADAAIIREIAGHLPEPFAAADSFFAAGAAPGSALMHTERFRNMFILQDNLDSEIVLGSCVATTLIAPYPGLPVPLLTEVIPRRHGGAELCVHARTSEIAPAFGAQLVTTLHQTLHRLSAEL